MIYGISGAPIPSELPYAGPVMSACLGNSIPPCFMYAIAWRETIREYGETAAVCLQDGGNYTTGLLPDGSNAGHGLCQLTTSWPSAWPDPVINVTYAITEFILPAIRYWHGLQRFTGDTLVLLVSATYNEGLGAAEKYHARGNVDAGTTDEYGHGVLGYYRNLVAGNRP